MIWSLPLELFDLAFYRSTTLVTHVNVLAKWGVRLPHVICSRNLIPEGEGLVFGGEDEGLLDPVDVPGQDFWPLRLAAVEAGKWGCGRPGRRFHCDAYELVGQDGVGDHRQELSIVA